MSGPPTTMSPPTAKQVRDLLVVLGLDPCAEHAPADEDEEVSGLLGALLAAAQRHIQDRRRHADVIDLAYHQARHHFGFPPCSCGSPHDIVVG